jgi:hypothetical protein
VARNRRKSLYLWTAVIAALLAAVLGFIGRPLAAYMSVKTAVEPREVDAGLEALRSSGPIGTELARRYLARQFAKDPLKASLMLSRHQVLFRGLPTATIIEYLGKPNAATPQYLNYPLAEARGRLRLMAIRLKNGVADGIFLDDMPLPEAREERPGTRPRLEPGVVPGPSQPQEPNPALEDMILNADELE